jgi:hypothetical protein
MSDYMKPIYQVAQLLQFTPFIRMAQWYCSFKAFGLKLSYRTSYPAILHGHFTDKCEANTIKHAWISAPISFFTFHDNLFISFNAT